MSINLIWPYCTLASVQRFIGNSTAEAVDDICDGINEASRYIDSLTDKIFYRKSYAGEKVQFQSKGRENWLLYGPVFGQQQAFIKSPFKPIIQGTLQVSDNMALLSEGLDYTVDYQNGKIYLNHVSAEASLKVTADVGLDNGTSPYNPAIPSPQIPGEIRFAAKRIAALSTGMLRKVIATDGEGHNQFYNPNSVPKDIAEILWFWRQKP